MHTQLHIYSTATNKLNNKLSSQLIQTTNYNQINNQLTQTTNYTQINPRDPVFYFFFGMRIDCTSNEIILLKIRLKNRDINLIPNSQIKLVTGTIKSRAVFRTHLNDEFVT